MNGSLDRIRVTKVTTTGFGAEARTSEEHVWEGTSVKELSSRYPRSEVMGADKLGYQSIEDGHVRWTHRFEGLRDGVWVEISDPRSIPAHMSALAVAISRENRRFFPGDYDDEWTDLGDYEPDDGYDAYDDVDDEYPYGYFSREDDSPRSMRSENVSDDEDPYAPEALAELYRTRPTFMVNGHHHLLDDPHDDVLKCPTCTPPTCRWCGTGISLLADIWGQGLCSSCEYAIYALDDENQVCRLCDQPLTPEAVQIGLDQCMDCLRLEHDTICHGCNAELTLEERGWETGMCQRCSRRYNHPVTGHLIRAKNALDYALIAVQSHLFGRIFIWPYRS